MTNSHSTDTVFAYCMLAIHAIWAFVSDVVLTFLFNLFDIQFEDRIDFWVKLILYILTAIAGLRYIIRKGNREKLIAKKIELEIKRLEEGGKNEG